MFETAVVGSKDWAIGLLTAGDMLLLEDFDCEMRIRYLQQKQGRKKVKTYDELVEENADRVPSHCEHGIPLHRKCGVCRALHG